MRGRKTARDVSTLAGKVASLNGTAGLQIRFSAFIEEEADANMIIPTAGPVCAQQSIRRHQHRRT